MLDQDAKWWTAAIDHLISETAKPGPGNRAVLARLSELLFVEVVRWQLTYISEGHRGWLAGLKDPDVGLVAQSGCTLQPALPWTVEELAQRAGISRAGLAKRFVDLVGEAPMNISRAGECILRGDFSARRATRPCRSLPLGSATSSEAAFSRAFRRAVGTPPATWRDANAATNEEASEEPTVIRQPAKA